MNDTGKVIARAARIEIVAISSISHDVGMCRFGTCRLHITQIKIYLASETREAYTDGEKDYEKKMARDFCIFYRRRCYRFYANDRKKNGNDPKQMLAAKQKQNYRFELCLRWELNAANNA